MLLRDNLTMRYPQSKILFYGSFTGGGTERVTFNLASSLAESGVYDVYVLNTRPRPTTFALSPKVKYITIRAAARFPHPLISRILDIRRFIKEMGIDIAVSIEALTGITLIPAIVGLPTKAIVWEHANYFQTQNSRWTRLIRKIWLHRAKAYVVLTKRDKRNFETQEKPWCPIVQIYNPVDIENSTDYDSTSRRIISVGHLLPIKQFHLIPEIFSHIANNHPDWTWHIYGEGPERAHIETEIKSHHLEGRVILEGATKHIDSEYAKSAIYVLTSKMEGLPTVLIEAQKHNLPCVAFDIETGPDEIITDGVNGCLIPAYDTKAMASALSQLITDNTLRCQFAGKARADMARYKSENIVPQWEKLINDISI